MSKSSRVVFLSCTSVLAAAAFVGMWNFRPAAESDVLKAARERQQKGLVAVREPLETNVKKLSDEEKMAQKVKDLLLADEDFATAASEKIAAREDFQKALEPFIQSRVDAYAKAYEPQVAAMIDEGVANKEIPLDALVDQLIEPVSVKVYQDFMDKGAIDALVQQVMDRLQPMLDEKVGREEMDKYLTAETMAPIVQAVIDDNRESLVTETVLEVLDQLDESAQRKAASQQIVKEPVLDDVPSVKQEADYKAARRQTRETAIQGVLRKLQNN